MINRRIMIVLPALLSRGQSAPLDGEQWIFRA